jgi:hypothetical protein
MHEVTRPSIARTRIPVCLPDSSDWASGGVGARADRAIPKPQGTGVIFTMTTACAGTSTEY